MIKCFRLNRHEKILVLKNLLYWQKGSDVLSEHGCFILSFGYSDPFFYPATIVSLDLDLNISLNVGTHGNQSPNKCAIVVIGGKYLGQVDDVMDSVDKITEDIDMMPYAVFLMAERHGQNVKFNVSLRDNMAPTMYQVPATRSSVVQFVMTCPGMSHSSSFTLHLRDNGKVDGGKV